MKVAVVGCGYVGLVSAVGLAGAGHDVLGIEAHEARRAQIGAGDAPFHEPGLREALQRALAGGRFRVSAAVADVAEADVVLLAVQTPPGDDGAIDLQYLETAAEAVARVFATDPRHRVLATRSTVVPGTAQRVVAPVLRANHVADMTSVASNPEFLREGSALEDFMHPDRVVVGCDEPWGRWLLEELYAPLGAPVVTTTPSTAELAKYTSNALLAMMISFSNEIGRICEGLPGVDVEDVLGIIHLDRRLRPRIDGVPVIPEILSYLKAGCGFGGSCLPKDLSALIAHARGSGTDVPLLEAVRTVNDNQPARLVGIIGDALNGIGGRTIAVLGVAFKAGTDDVRDSPGLDVVARLLDQGAHVRIYDPLVRAAALPADVRTAAVIAESLDEALEGADCCVLTTNDQDFAAVASPAASGPDPVVVDGRRVLQAAKMPEESFYAIGRAHP